MRISFFKNLKWLWLLVCLALPPLLHAQNPIYGISSPSTFSVTNIQANTVLAGLNPVLNLTAGATYKFVIGTASFHPVIIVTNNIASPPLNNVAYSAASPQAINSGTITLTIPASNFPATLFYRCNVHGFTGQINILPTPPTNRIVSLAVTTNIVLVSTGVTNTWVFTPEYSSNLVSGAWTTVPGFTNTFANNTNTTRFSRLNPICGPNIFLRVRQSPPN